tara:strand:- start:3106 stop:3639 length:534 start_codon:yes stop_codon:yes gene_type:complete
MLGVSLTGLIRSIDFDDALVAFPAFMTLALMPYLYSIDHAIEAGLISHILLYGMNFMYTKLCGSQLPQQSEFDNENRGNGNSTPMLEAAVDNIISNARDIDDGSHEALKRYNSAYDDHFLRRKDSMCSALSRSQSDYLGFLTPSSGSSLRSRYHSGAYGTPPSAVRESKRRDRGVSS